jgi:pimeloyl-ACP methyl ester carboxylesterase
VLIRLCMLAALWMLAACGAPRVAGFMRPPRAPADQTVAGNLEAARGAWRLLADPSFRRHWPAACEEYNRAVAAAFDDLRRADPDWDRAAVLTGTRIADPGPDLSDPDLLGAVFPASEVDTRRLGERFVTPGIGLPVVGWIDEGTRAYEDLRFPPPSGATRFATVLLRFDRGPVPTWAFRQPQDAESVRIGAASHPLKADWSASLALYWQMSRLDDAKLVNMFLPQRLQRDEGISFTRSFDPGRIPLVLVHGLKSSPDIFDRMVNELARVAEIRRNYQLWIYSYPTGMPWPLTARNFRGHFREAVAFARERGARRLDHTVIVGHSMGGLITQASLREPGSAVFDAFSDKPLEQLAVRPGEREFLRETLMWEPLPRVRHAVFLAAPHRGSPMANQSFAMMAAKLIRLPKTLTVEFADVLVRNAAAISAPELVAPEESLRVGASKVRIPTAIESLQPNRRMMQIVPNLAFRQGVSTHSVIGDRGLGDTPESSDGVVPYWSSHLDEVDSELIVPSDHGVPRNPEAIEEVKRILLLNLRRE